MVCLNISLMWNQQSLWSHLLKESMQSLVSCIDTYIWLCGYVWATP